MASRTPSPIAGERFGAEPEAAATLLGEEAAAVLDELGNESVRTILATLTAEPASAKDIGDSAGIPQSTVYRHLSRLADVGLLEQGTRLNDGGHHVSVFRVVPDGLTVRIDPPGDGEGLAVALDRGADEREPARDG